MSTDIDTYAMPLPGPDTPVIPVRYLAAVHATLNARYKDPIWSLAPLIENPSARKISIHWSRWPPGFREDARLAAWTMINGELRPTFLRDRGGALRARVSAANVSMTLTEWQHLTFWMKDRGLRSTGECDSAVLHDYGFHLRDRGNGRERVAAQLTAVTRWWAFDELSGRPAGIGRPPWDENGMDEYLPAATPRSGENKTEVLAEATMGPLLIWAVRMVEEFAGDILAAWAENRRLTKIARSNSPSPAGLAALRSYVDQLTATGGPIPSTPHRGRGGVAHQYIAALTGASVLQVQNLTRRRGLLALARQRPGPCPLGVTVNGKVNGAPWRTAICFAESARLMRHLGTACFIVIAYLTGMRTGEVLGLRSGCCPDPPSEPDGTIRQHRISGHTYKTARDENGNHLSSGVVRQVPWVAIAPVVNAIRVLERIVPDGQLLFHAFTHDLVSARSTNTGSLTSGSMGQRVEDFIAWVNNEASRYPHAEIIPPDPHGQVGTMRFRRTLAWHIARRPGGLVALAIQYGHLRTSISTGYASRARDGIHTLLDIETVRSVADTVTELQDNLAAGGGVSGPAGVRAIRAAVEAPRFAGTHITATTAKRYLANSELMVYESSHALLMCVYKRDQALCNRDVSKSTPTLDRCVAGCGNVARTDQHAAMLRDRADVLDDRANYAPKPLGDRLRNTAVRLRGLADNHDHTRVTVQETT